jgi:phage regulator Rha-like protein
MAKTKKNIVKISPIQIVINKIRLVRGHKVMLDHDLANLYEVETRVLNQAVKRNLDKFPGEFVFQLTRKEYNSLRSQIVILKPARGQHRKFLPYAFTEHGVAMAATVLKSDKAAKMSVAIVKTFIEVRKQILDYDSLAKQIKALKHHLDGHDAQLNQIYEAIENLLDEKAEKKNWEERKRIGFKIDK